MFNMGLAKAYLDTIREVFHCRTYASHVYLPLMLDDTIPEERKLALSIGKQLLDFCDVLIICGERISSGMEGEIRYAHDTGKEVYWLEGGRDPFQYRKIKIGRRSNMRCRYRKTIFLNEENGYTIAVFTTKDASVPLAARDKYLQGQKVIGFIAIGFDLPQSDQIEIEMEGQWESPATACSIRWKISWRSCRARRRGSRLPLLRFCKGCGAKVAEAIYKEFGLNTLEIMEEHPQELLKVKGISQKKLKGIVESYGKNQGVPGTHDIPGTL